MASVIGTTVSPAEAVAAAICWLARAWQGPAEGAAFVIARAQSELHPPGKCRFCDIPPAKLLDISSATRHMDRAVIAAFESLSHAARWARIREVQAIEWYDDPDSYEDEGVSLHKDSVSRSA